MKINRNIFYSVICFLLYGCAGILYENYKPKTNENSFVYIEGSIDRYQNLLNIYVDFSDTVSIYKIDKLNVLIYFDTLVLTPVEYNPPGYSENASSFEKLPEASKYSLVNNYRQYVISFNLNKEIKPKELLVKLHLEGKNDRNFNVKYDIDRVLHFKKHRQFLPI